MTSVVGFTLNDIFSRFGVFGSGVCICVYVYLVMKLLRQDLFVQRCSVFVPSSPDLTWTW